jgi:excisionase family DNA binding protein
MLYVAGTFTYRTKRVFEMAHDLMTTREAAECLGLTYQQLMWRLYHGRIAATKVGRQWLIRREDVVAALPKAAA